MSEAAGLIVAEVDGCIGRFTINRPDKRNAMTLAMWGRMGDVLQAWADDPAVRVIVVGGAGDKCFCAGNDISEFKGLRATPDQVRDYDVVTARAYAALRDIQKPTIARIAGFCIGGGLEVSQLCDIQISADSATFAVTPAKLGLGYKLEDVLLLTGNVGRKYAKEILFTGRRFSAEDALRMGLVNRLVPAAALDAAVDGYAAEIAGNAPLAVKAAKVPVNQSAREEGRRDSALCRALADACTESEDYREGLRAFAEKRRPDFKGR